MIDFQNFNGAKTEKQENCNPGTVPGCTGGSWCGLAMGGPRWFEL